MEELKDYFQNTTGRGILATADDQGRVDAAVYAKPHFMDDETVAFIMADRLTHHNLQSNPYAAYLFMEDGPAYRGKRLFLIKQREEEDTELLFTIRSRKYPSEKVEGSPRFLVFFKIYRVLPLIGAERGEDIIE
jgi:hypothetical protein